MTHRNACIVIDVGGHAIRAMAFEQTGNVLASEFSAYDTEFPCEGCVEHSAPQMDKALHFVVDSVMRQMSAQDWQVVRAGIATQRSTFVCWDQRHQRALSPVISWRDTRTASDLQEFSPFKHKIYCLSGLPLNAHYGASKMRWCLVNSDSVQQALSRRELVLAPLASWCVNRLTLAGDALRVDVSNAQRTLLLNLHDGQWDEQLLQLFGVPLQALPRIENTRANYGSLHDYPATPLLCVTGDQNAFVYSYGALRTDSLYVNLGTGAFLLSPLARVASVSDLASRVAETGLLLSCLEKTDVETRYALEGTVNGAGAALEWLRKREQQLVLPTYEQVYAIESNDTCAIAPVFLNGISGLGSPFWRAQFTSEWIDAESYSQRYLAVYESILFLLFYNYACMRRITRGLERILISGGLSASDLYCQKMANLFALPVERFEDSEATAAGTAYLAWDKPQQWCGRKLQETFRPENDPALRVRYDKWWRLLQQRLGV